MARVGIVAEFNPFHTGHKYIIDYAKNELQADSVVIALGNEFTQRGGVAIIDRYTRAKCAIDAGADLVVGMPVIASCASAEIFAECGVCLLHACGCEKIVCGYEGSGYSDCNDNLLIRKIAEILIEEPSAYKNALQKSLHAGQNFPVAREAALTEYFSISYKTNSVSDSNIPFDKNGTPSVRSIIKSLISSPNNILTIEYQKAILKHGFDIELIPVKRQGTAYNDSVSDGEYVSASYIRRAINDGDFSAIKKHLTPYSYQVLKDAYEKKLLLTDDDLSLPLHLSLLSHDSYHDYSDVSDDLADRIRKLLPQYTSFESFTRLVKNKSLTASRIRRSMIHILLSITNDDLESLRASEFVPYLWILSASKNGFALLGDIKATSQAHLFMSINELKDKKLDEPLFHQDLKALELVRALRINKSRMLIPNENLRKIYHL